MSDLTNLTEITPKPISEKQLAANRANAAKSTGPTTEDGKNTSRMNASKHGLTGIAVLMRPEEGTARHLFITEYVSRLNPEGPVETEHAEAVAEQSWRLKRARAIDQNIFALSDPALYNQPDVHENPEICRAIAQASAFIENTAALQRLTIYEQRIQRSLDKSLALLNALQAERKAARAEALRLAADLARLNHAQGMPYHHDTDFPAQNGFVFSDDEIRQTIHLADRKSDAKFYLANGWDMKNDPRPKNPPVVERAKAA